jgi:tetratricopeptide (TPR) repeat protein
VIGKVFWPGALEGADERVLHALERKEFTRRDRRSSIAGETQYAFLHALVRDVAYGQMPRSERVEKHRRAAEWLSSLAGDRTEDLAEMLAHHYHEALSLARAAGLDTTALHAPARQAFADGARRAFSLGAGRAAHDLALEALSLTPEEDPERPSLLLLAADASRISDRDDVVALGEAAVEGFLARGEAGRAAEAVANLVADHFHRGDIAATRTARDRALELARQDPTSPSAARAMAAVGRSRYLLDRDEQGALELSRETLALARQAGDGRAEAICLNTIGLARVRAGDAEGLADIQRSVELAAESGSLFHLVTGMNNFANVLWEVGRLSDASTRLQEARTLAERYGLTGLLRWNDAELVYAAYFEGELDAVIEEATSILDKGLGSAAYQERPLVATRACALLAQGRVDEALADAERALAGFREAGSDAQVASIILTTAARCLRGAGRPGEAEPLLEEVLSGEPDDMTFDLPLELAELGRGDDYAAANEGRTGHAWLEAGRAAASGELARASEIYGSIGARFPAAWAALLAAERGDTSRLDAALAYFEEQHATPYVQRCRALMQASA